MAVQPHNMHLETWLRWHIRIHLSLFQGTSTDGCTATQHAPRDLAEMAHYDSLFTVSGCSRRWMYAHAARTQRLGGKLSRNVSRAKLVALEKGAVVPSQLPLPTDSVLWLGSSSIPWWGSLTSRNNFVLFFTCEFVFSVVFVVVAVV